MFSHSFIYKIWTQANVRKWVQPQQRYSLLIKMLEGLTCLCFTVAACQRYFDRVAWGVWLFLKSSYLAVLSTAGARNVLCQVRSHCLYHTLICKVSPCNVRVIGSQTARPLLLHYIEEYSQMLICHRSIKRSDLIDTDICNGHQVLQYVCLLWYLGLSEQVSGVPLL